MVCKLKVKVSNKIPEPARACHTHCRFGGRRSPTYCDELAGSSVTSTLPRGRRSPTYCDDLAGSSVTLTSVERLMPVQRIPLSMPSIHGWTVYVLPSHG